MHKCTIHLLFISQIPTDHIDTIKTGQGYYLEDVINRNNYVYTYF